MWIADEMEVDHNPLISITATSAETTWSGLTVTQFSIKSGFMPGKSSNDATHLSFGIGGSPNISWKEGSRDFRRTCKYGEFTFMGKDYEFADISIAGENQALMIGIEPKKLQAWLQDDPFQNFSDAALAPHFYGEDTRLFSLALVMRDEIARSCPSGRMFAESISLALLHCLFGTYQNKQASRHKEINGLPPYKLRLLEEYIQANIGQDLSLGQLAALVNVSPRHLCRSFSKATGIPPHRYVLHRRIDRAKVLLKSKTMSVTDVALELGFASPSHFSVAFRKVAGMSPKQFLQSE